MDNKLSVAVVVEHDQNSIKPVTYEILQVASRLANSVTAYYFSGSRETDPKALFENGGVPNFGQKVRSPKNFQYAFPAPVPLSIIHGTG